MLLKVHKSEFFDIVLLSLMYLQLTILEFFGFGQLLNKIVVVLVIFRLFTKPSKIEGRIQFCIIGLLFLYFINVLTSSAFVLKYVLSNFLMQFYPFIYTYYLLYICKNKPDLIDRLLEKGFWIFNITMVMNIVVLLLQIFYPFSIKAVITSSVIDFYEDTISGLFAYASTHAVCLFTIFIVLYNLSYLKKINNLLFKNVIIAYLILIVFLSVFIAQKNDNKAFFILFPIVFFIYEAVKISSETRKKVARVFILCMFLLMIVFIIYSFYQPFRIFLDENVFRTIELVKKSMTIGNNSNGSNERIAIIGYALKCPSTWLFGTGFASTFIYEGGYHGFNHFGQADLGSLLILGGIWHTILLVYYYSLVFYRIMMRRKEKKTRVLFWGFMVILLCTITYTQAFTRTNTIICLMLISLAFRVQHKNE